MKLKPLHADLALITIITIQLAIIGFGAAGWATNIFRLTQIDSSTPLGLTIARAVGIPIIPVGSVLGYFPN